MTDENWSGTRCGTFAATETQLASGTLIDPYLGHGSFSGLVEAVSRNEGVNCDRLRFTLPERRAFPRRAGTGAILGPHGKTIRTLGVSFIAPRDLVATVGQIGEEANPGKRARLLPSSERSTATLSLGDSFNRDHGAELSSTVNPAGKEEFLGTTEGTGRRSS